MRTLFCHIIAATLLLIVSCQSEYDKMSDNEKYQKAISDIGITTQIPLEDILKGVPIWNIREYFIFGDSSRKNVKYHLSFGGNDKDKTAGGLAIQRESFVFDSELKYYNNLPSRVSQYHGYYINYAYSINSDNSLRLHTDLKISEELELNAPATIKVVAYNIEHIALEAELTNGENITYILQVGTQASKEYLEKSSTDIETYEKLYWERFK